MKPHWRALPLALAACLAADAQIPSEPASPPADVRRELTYLLRADAQALIAAENQPAPVPSTPAGGAVVLDPYIVRESKNPDLPTPHFEPALQRFMRTGTIFNHVGKKVTSSLYFNIGGSDVPVSGSSSQSFRSELGWRISF